MTEMLNEKQLAKLLGVSVQLIRKWRGNGDGPSFVRLGTRRVYEISAVDEFVRNRTITQRGTQKCQSVTSKFTRVQFTAATGLLLNARLDGWHRGIAAALGSYFEMEALLEGETIQFNLPKDEYSRPEVWGPRYLGKAFQLAPQDSDLFLESIEQVTLNGFVTVAQDNYHTNDTGGLCHNGVPLATFGLQHVKKKTIEVQNEFPENSSLYRRDTVQMIEIGIRTRSGVLKTLTVPPTKLWDAGFVATLAGPDERVHDGLGFAIAAGSRLSE